jgi:hypothetical protein
MMVLCHLMLFDMNSLIILYSALHVSRVISALVVRNPKEICSVPLDSLDMKPDNALNFSTVK